MQKNHYDESYFLWQKKLGVIGGKADVFKFVSFVNLNDTVLDFGCGGGYILSNLMCKKRVGIELNDTARQQAVENGIEVYKYSDEVPDNYCDLIISNHALEHTFNPYIELKSLYSKLKQNGMIVFIVPNEKKKKWNPNDINKHLYTWSEINIGNLFAAAGYSVINVKEIYHRWPPMYDKVYKIFGSILFHLICRIYGFSRRNLSQIQIVASK